MAAAPLWSHFPFLVAYSALGGLVVGMLSSTEIALFMDLANPRAGATHFQLYMSALNLKSTGAEYLGGQVATRVSPATMFGLGGLLELLPLPLLLFIDPAAVRRALGRNDETPREDPGGADHRDPQADKALRPEAETGKLAE
jgi:MFS family permease